MINTEERKWLKLGLIAVIVVLSIGVLKTICCDLFLEKKQGKLVAIKQKYSAEGDVKLLTLTFGQEEASYTHRYINKEYLPSPQLKELEQHEYVVTYIPKKKNSQTFYGLELPDGKVIQSKRWDVLSAYLNQPVVVFMLVIIPTGIYIAYRRKLLLKKRDFYGLLLYGFMLAYMGGKLHVFLMIVLIVGLVKLGQHLSRPKGEPVVDNGKDASTA